MPKKKMKENETVNIDTTNLINIDDIKEYEYIKIKSYLPLEVRMQMVDDIVNSITEINEDGMLTVNYKIKPMMFDIVILREFTNINIYDVEISEAYNKICQYGIMKYIYGEINNYAESEFNYIKECVENEIKQKVALTNSLESVVDRNMKNFITMVEDISDKALVTLEKLGNKAIETLPTAKEANKVLKNYGKVVSPEGAKLIKSLYEVFTNKSINIPVNTNTNTDIPKMTKEDKEKLKVVK